MTGFAPGAEALPDPAEQRGFSTSLTPYELALFERLLAGALLPREQPPMRVQDWARLTPALTESNWIDVDDERLGRVRYQAFRMSSSALRELSIDALDLVIVRMQRWISAEESAQLDLSEGWVEALESYRDGDSVGQRQAIAAALAALAPAGCRLGHPAGDGFLGMALQAAQLQRS